VRLIKIKGAGQILRYLLQGDAHPPSRYMTVGLELRDHVHRHIDRNGERQPHVTAAAAEDLRVDAHDLAGQVEQRTGVDRHIGLNERDIGIVRQGPTQGADDALGRGALQPERRADGEHPLPDLEGAGIADRDGWQIFGVVTVGKFLASIFSNAISDCESLPITLAGNSRLSFSLTVILSASFTTCRLVMI